MKPVFPEDAEALVRLLKEIATPTTDLYRCTKLKAALDIADRLLVEKTWKTDRPLRISLPGVLELAAKDTCRTRAFILRELLKHLRELKERSSEGTKVINEFFALYDVE